MILSNWAHIMKSIALILSLFCTEYTPDYLDNIADYMNTKRLSPVVELSTGVLHKDIQDLCKRNSQQTIKWVTEIIRRVDKENWKKDGVGVIYTPSGLDYRVPTG